MQKTHKFLFETSFDCLPLKAEDKENGGPLPPAPPLFSLEEKEEAYQQGYKEGYAQGEQAGAEKERSSTSRAIQELLAQICDRVQASLDKIHDQKKIIIQQVIQFVHQIFQKLFPLLEQRFSVEQVKELIKDVLDCESPPSLKIFVHPRLKKPLEDELKDIRFPCPVLFEGNEDFSLSNCKIEWQDSGVERSISQITTDIESLLKGFENVFEESKGCQEIDGDDKPQSPFKKEETLYQENGEGL